MSVIYGCQCLCTIAYRNYYIIVFAINNEYWPPFINIDIVPYLIGSILRPRLTVSYIEVCTSACFSKQKQDLQL